MQIDENFRKFPIKFYRKPDGSIHYENKFLSGDAKNMEQAFKIFSGNDWERDLLFYYDDVIDVEFGAFTPAYRDKKYKGMLYLGQIELNINVDKDWAMSEHSISYLVKHPEAHEEQRKFISKLKREAELDKFKDKIKNGFKKIVGIFKHEMFFPEKTRQDLICDHCGEIIPTGNYYEEYHGTYHLECIWDKLCNKKKSNSYQDCREFFFSLQRIRKWPATGLDVKDDYLIDLDLVKSNDRRNPIKESAAMYKSNQPNFQAFYDYVIKNPKEKKCYFEIKNPYNLRIPSDTVLHDYNKHGTTYDMWDDAISNLENIQNASISKRKIGSSPADIALIRILGFKDYGMSIQLANNYNQIMTLFSDNANSIDNWIKTSSAGGLSNKPTAALGTSPVSVVQPSQNSTNIIQYILQKVKS